VLAIFKSTILRDPATGRFISQDTLFGEMTSPLTQNLYTYCGNNPLNLIDPSGNWWNPVKSIKNAVSKVVNTVDKAVKVAKSFTAGLVSGVIQDTFTTVGSVIDTVSSGTNALIGTNWGTNNAQNISNWYQETEADILNNKHYQKHY